MDKVTVDVSIGNIDRIKELVSAAELKLSELKEIIEELEQFGVEIK